MPTGIVVYLNDEAVAMGLKSAKTLGASPVTLQLNVEDADGAFKRATDAGAKVKMPLMDMFWGDRYGQVSDPFGGTSPCISCGAGSRSGRRGACRWPWIAGAESPRRRGGRRPRVGLGRAGRLAAEEHLYGHTSDGGDDDHDRAPLVSRDSPFTDLGISYASKPLRSHRLGDTAAAHPPW